MVTFEASFFSNGLEGRPSAPTVRTGWWLFVVVMLVYFGTVNGITCSNDGSHYALVRSMAERGRLNIDEFFSYTESNDYALRNGRLYSDRPPGTAFAAAVLYTAGRVLSWAFFPVPSVHDPGNPFLLFAVSASVLAGAATVYLFFRLLAGWGVGMEASLGASLALAFGTPLWKYSAVLFSHSPSAFLVLSSYALAVTAGPLERESLRRRLLLGASLGYAVTVEYTNILPVALIVIYLAVAGRLASRKAVRAALPAGLVMLLVLGLLMTYHTVSFGHPLHTAYRHHATYPWARSFTSTFDGSLIYGIKGFLLGNRHSQGIFLLSPFQVLSVIGFWFFRHARRAEAALAASILIATMLLMGKHRTFHGFTFDGRYMTPYWTFLVLGLGFGLQRLQLLRSRHLHFWGWAVFGLLAVLSAVQMAHHIGFSYGYTLEPSDLGHPVASREAWMRVIGAIFPNWRNVPVMAVMLIVVMGINKGVGWMRRRSGVKGSHNC
ncbi:MAG: hypothetical protein JRI22_17675 [Deltaproteobacteria bacterium]|nr:hypothetical protein [Deltaproteobacteria bacterium]